jgi:acyl-CoA synthetase (AMP-forming)/AMP-acid ligase II
MATLVGHYSGITVMNNLASLLIDHPFEDSDPLIHTVDRSVTAGEARAAARSFAASLQDQHVRPGQGVAVQLPDGPEAIIAMFGVWLADGVFIPVNPRYTESEVDRVLTLTGAAVLATPGRILPLDKGRVYPAGTGLVLWTSGTAGPPKAIVHTHTAYLEILDRVLGTLRQSGPATPRRPAPNLIPVSLALNAGIYNTLFGLRAGADLVLLERFVTGTFAALVQRFGVRSTVLPPAAITMLNDDAAVSDLTPLRYVRSITAPLSPLQATRFREKFGAFVLNGYGQAEIGEVIGWTADDAKRFPEKIGAVGRPHAGVDIKLLDDSGQAVTAGAVGRLWVRPPNRAAAYAGGEDLDDRVDAEGFVDTGDLARIDDEGFVWLEGRAGDAINRGGNKVFPAEVEEVLRLFVGITDAVVVGVPDRRLGEVPTAFFTGVDADADELEALCRAHLVPYKVPVAFHHVDDFPVNDAGKVLRAQLVARLARR